MAPSTQTDDDAAAQVVESHFRQMVADGEMGLTHPSDFDDDE